MGTSFYILLYRLTPDSLNVRPFNRRAANGSRPANPAVAGRLARWMVGWAILRTAQHRVFYVSPGWSCYEAALFVIKSKKTQGDPATPYEPWRLIASDCLHAA